MGNHIKADNIESKMISERELNREKLPEDLTNRCG